VSYGNGLPERCFRCSLTCVGVQGMCRGGRDGRQAGCPVAKVQVSEGAAARSARLSVQFMCHRQGSNLRSRALEGNPVRDNYLVKRAVTVWLGRKGAAVPANPPGRRYSGPRGCPGGAYRSLMCRKLAAGAWAWRSFTEVPAQRCTASGQTPSCRRSCRYRSGEAGLAGCRCHGPPSRL
jgi:hypothetical protein